MNILLELFLTFAKIGLFTFGGGYAMISVIENTCVERKKWITHEEMIHMTVIAESTPGPIAINCATFTGYRRAGLAGAVAATMGVVTPSLGIIYAISQFLDRFLEIAVVDSAFRGIKVAVGLLILDAAVTMIRKMEKKTLPLLILTGSCAVMLCVSFFGWRVSTVSLMLLAGAVSLTAVTVRRMWKGGGEE